MKRQLLLLLISACLPSFAFATLSEELMDQLKTEIQAYSAKNPGEEGGRNYQLQQMMMQLVRRGDDESGENYAAYIDQMAMAAPNDKIREIAKALAPELKKERETRDAALSEALTKTVGEALRKCLDATTAKEMDEPLASVGKLLRDNQRSYRNSRLQQQYQLASQAQEFMRQLQNLAANVEDENGNGSQRLRNLLSSQYDFSEFIPRSELLEKIKAIEKRMGVPVVKERERQVTAEDWNRQMTEMLSSVKTLEEIPTSLDKIAKLRPANLGYTNSSLQQELQSLSASYQEILRGQGTSFNLTNFRTNGSGENGAVLEPLRAQLVSFALPRLLQLPPGNEPQKDETTINFLQRQMSQAKQEHNWALMQRVIELSQRLSLQMSIGPSDTSALNLFLAGSNQERAKQYALAVSSYLATLKTGSQAVPAEHVGDLLAAIKKDHPSEYEEGTRTPYEPPISSDAVMRARMGNYPFPGGLPPGYPRTNAAIDSATAAATQRLTVPPAPAQAEAPKPAGPAAPTPTPIPAESPAAPPKPAP